MGLNLQAHRISLFGATRGAPGVFGSRITPEDYRDRPDDYRLAKSVLAAVCQSFEARIMSVILPVVLKHDRLHLIAWLHDGADLKSGDQQRLECEVSGDAQLHLAA